MTDDKTIRDMISACWRKTSFLSMKRANQAAARVFHESGLQLYSYSCPYCGCVHLTKQRYGSSHLKYRPYKRYRTMWDKEHEFNCEKAA